MTDLANEARDRGFEEGRLAAWRSILRQGCCELGHDEPAVGCTQRIVERGEAVAALRDICREFGDNDWPDNLWLPDVIEKHLQRHLGDK